MAEGRGKRETERDDRCRLRVRGFGGTRPGLCRWPHASCFHSRWPDDSTNSRPVSLGIDTLDLFEGSSRPEGSGNEGAREKRNSVTGATRGRHVALPRWTRTRKLPGYPEALLDQITYLSPRPLEGACGRERERVAKRDTNETL